MAVSIQSDWQNDLRFNNVTNPSQDPTNLYVQLYSASATFKDEAFVAVISDVDASLSLQQTTPLFNLFSIHVPAHLQRQGLATRVIEFVEELAKEQGKRGVFIGPLVTNDSQWIERIARRCHYQPQPPFGYLLRFPSF